MKYLVLVLLTLSLVSCSSLAGKEYSLSVAGEKVKVMDYISPSEKEFLEEFNMVRCDMNRGIGSLDQNIELCTIKMRNKAAQLGATHLLIEAEKQKYGPAAFRTFDQTSCNSCVNMRGLVFRKKEMDKKSL